MRKIIIFIISWVFGVFCYGQSMENVIFSELTERLSAKIEIVNIENYDITREIFVVDTRGSFKGYMNILHMFNIYETNLQEQIVPRREFDEHFKDWEDEDYEWFIYHSNEDETLFLKYLFMVLQPGNIYVVSFKTNSISLGPSKVSISENGIIFKDLPERYYLFENQEEFEGVFILP